MSDTDKYVPLSTALQKLVEAMRERRAALRVLDTRPSSKLALCINAVDDQWGVLLPMILRDNCSLAHVAEILKDIRVAAGDIDMRFREGDLTP